MINYGREEKRGQNGKIKSGNTNRPIRFDSRSRVANKLLVCIVLLFLLPCAERGVVHALTVYCHDISPI